MPDVDADSLETIHRTCLEIESTTRELLPLLTLPAHAPLDQRRRTLWRVKEVLSRLAELTKRANERIRAHDLQVPEHAGFARDADGLTRNLTDMLPAIERWADTVAPGFLTGVLFGNSLAADHAARSGQMKQIAGWLRKRRDMLREEFRTIRTMGGDSSANPVRPHTSAQTHTRDPQTGLWRTSLADLRERFDRAGQRFGVLYCRLVETTQREQARLHEAPVGGHGEPAETAIRGYPSVRRGAPVVRRIDFWGDRAGAEEFRRIATDAARVLPALPEPARHLLPAHAFHFSDYERWTCALFELAWRPPAGSPLAADRFTWTAGARFKLDDEGTLRALRERAAAILPDLATEVAEISEPPEHFYSCIDDAFRASVQAIDILTAACTHPAAPAVQSAKTAKPEQGAQPSARPTAGTDAGLPPSRQKAKTLYEWAIEHIEGAESMTYAQLFYALQEDPRCGGEGLPPNAQTWSRYLREAGVKRYGARPRRPTRSIRRADRF